MLNDSGGGGVTNYPGIWAEAFQGWVRDGRPRAAIIGFESHDVALPADLLLATLFHCNDVMPDDTCEELELPAGSAYSIAARKLHREVPAPRAAPSLSASLGSATSGGGRLC
jgi:hypothetical protein